MSNDERYLSKLLDDLALCRAYGRLLGDVASTARALVYADSDPDQLLAGMVKDALRRFDDITAMVRALEARGSR